MIKKSVVRSQKEIVASIAIPPEIKETGSILAVKVSEVFSGNQMETIAASYASKGQKRDYGVDIMAEIKKHPDDLWVVVRAIDADVPNDNGDCFPTDELLSVVKVADGKEMPAYKTFEGCPVFSNHENDDIEKARGKVVHAKWVEVTNEPGKEGNYVECLLRIDSQAYPRLARGVEKDYIDEVSMGCQVERSKCSICGTVAANEDEYCTHIKNHKSKRFTGKVEMADGNTRYAKEEEVYEINEGIKFIEISWVADGACENCKKVGIVDIDSVVAEVGITLDKTAKIMEDNIKIIQASGNEVSSLADIMDVDDFIRDCEVMVENVNNLIAPISILVADDDVDAKEVVAQMYKNAAQEDIDRLRAALAVMEDVARVILSRREAINLQRLEELAGVMSDLQKNIEKLIDDGFGMASAADVAPIGQEPIPQGVSTGQAQGGLGTITQPQMQYPQQQVSHAVQVNQPEVIPSGQLPIAASNDYSQERYADVLNNYDLNISKIKEFRTAIEKNTINQRGCENMISQRDQEVLDFSQKLKRVIADRFEKNLQPDTSVKLSVKDAGYEIILNEDSFDGYYDGEKLETWSLDSLDSDVKIGLYKNPEIVAAQILQEFKDIYSVEGGGELMPTQSEKVKEIAADKKNESVDHDQTEEVLLSKSRDSGHKDVGDETVEEQEADVRDTAYTQSVQDDTVEGQLEDKGARDIAKSKAVMHETVEEQQATKGRDEAYTESVDGKTTERQMADANLREDTQSPLLEKNLGGSREDDNYDEYPGYTNPNDGPSGPGFGKDTDFPTPKNRIKVDEDLREKSASMSRDLVDVLSQTVLASEMPPRRILAQTTQLLSDDNVVAKIREYGSEERKEAKEADEYFEKDISVADRLLDGLAVIAANNNIAEEDVRDFVLAIIEDRKILDIVSKHAKAINKQEEKEAKDEGVSLSKEAIFRMAFRKAFAEDLDASNVSEENIKEASEILSSIIDSDVIPEDVLEAAKVLSTEPGEFTIMLEESSTEEAIRERERKTASAEWKAQLGEEGPTDIQDMILGKLAYVIANDNGDPEVIATSIANFVTAENALDTLREKALARLNADDTVEAEVVDAELEEVEVEADAPTSVNLVAATIEEVGVDVDDETFAEKAKVALLKVLSEENDMDAKTISIGDVYIEDDCVVASFEAAGGLEVEAQMMPGGMPPGGGMGYGGQPAAQMAQPMPGATVPPAPGVNAPTIPTEGGLGEEVPDGFPEPYEDALPEDLVPVEIYVRMPKGLGAGGELGIAGEGELEGGALGLGMAPAGMPAGGEMGGMAPGGGQPMAATYRLPGERLIKTAAQLSKQCPACKTAGNVDFEDSVGYCNECDTPFEISMKESDDNSGDLLACVQWVQPHEMQEVEIGATTTDDWWS